MLIYSLTRVMALSCLSVSCASQPTAPVKPPPAATGSLNVLVVDDRQAPVANVDVTLTHGSQSRNATTSPTGVAAFQDITAGAATVAITVPSRYRASEATRQVTISSSTSAASTTFQLTLRAAAIALSVTDSAGGYVPDVRFEITGAPNAEPIRGTTDSRGRATVSRVEVGSYVVTVVDTALGNFRGPVQVTLNDEQNISVQITTPPLRRGSWSEITTMPSARASLAAVANESTLFVLGGGTTAIDAFAGASWTRVGDTPQALNAPAAAIVANEIIIMGGFIGFTNQPTGRVEIFDIATSSWRQGRAMPTPRGGIQAAVLNGKVHVVGGGNQSSTLDQHEAYDPQTDRWTSLAPLPSSRGNQALVVLNGKLYAIGGASGGKNFSDVDIYDPVTNTWSAGPPLPRARVAARAVNYRGALYVLGGEVTFSGALDDALRLNVQTGTWEAMTRMPDGRSYAGAVVLGDAIYVVGGSTASATTHAEQGTNTVQRFFQLVR